MNANKSLIKQIKILVLRLVTLPTFHYMRLLIPNKLYATSVNLQNN